MNSNGETAHRIQFLYRPGWYLLEEETQALVERLRDTAATCFDQIPPYQVMEGSREEMSDKVLAIAWKHDDTIAGFCSTVLLPVPEVGEVLHLGLTCVRPEDRGSGLTHLLTRKVIVGHLLRHKPIGRQWVSNCAAVLSSLGNVALHFEKVFPSPIGKPIPSRQHVQIARAICGQHRGKMFVREDAVFDEESFVFRGSVKDTVFQKAADDRRYHHRNHLLNRFYQNLMDFPNGDEVLQVGYVSTLSTLKHAYRRKRLSGPSSEHSGFSPLNAYPDPC